MHDFRRLRVWQLSREFAVAITEASRRFPRQDNGVVAAQLRRAALSIPANIAEGCGKSSFRETLRFLQVASGSAVEAENHLLIAADLRYLPPSRHQELQATVTIIQKMLYRLIAALSARNG